MPNLQPAQLFRGLLLPLCFILPYWIYLMAATQPIVIYDAAGYEQLGKLLLEKGWGEYFRTGPNREPLFPFIISFSLRLEHWTGLSHFIFIKIVLMGALFITMLGVRRLMTLLGASRSMIQVATVYVGLSPVLLNSTLWLWSEAAAYPFVVWGIVWTVQTWKGLGEGAKAGRLLFTAFLVVAMFIGLSMVKAVAAGVFFFYLIPFYFYLIVQMARFNHAKVKRVSAVLIFMIGIFGGSIHAYKSLNHRYNGQYVLTDRGDWALYGNTVRRLQPLTKGRFNQAVLSVPRLGLCEKFYGKECVFWTFVVSDAIANQALQKLSASGQTSEERHKFFISQSLEWMRKHPFQQMGLMAIEGAKMLFWENKLYFVRYPAWLVKLYSQPALVYALCFGWAVLSLAGLAHGIMALVKKAFSRQWFGDDAACLIFILNFLFWFIAAYTLFFIDIRYAFPIAPLFVVLAAYALDRLWNYCKPNKSP